MNDLAADITHHAALDARMVKAVRGIKLLGLASWPATAQAPFLEGYARGQPRLPEIEYPRLDFSDERRELEAIADAADPAHPLGRYLVESTRSWGLAAQLLESLGTPAVTTHSLALFGKPDEALPGNGPTRARPRVISLPSPTSSTANCWRRRNRSRSRPPRCACNCRATSTISSTVA